MPYLVPGGGGLDGGVTANGCIRDNARDPAACHGADGKGNQMLGAPNLTDNIWLYGGSEAKIIETLNNGRGGKMPAFAEQLSAEKIHVLATYVYSLSK